MSQNTEGNVKTFTAGEALAVNRRVKYNSSSAVVYSDAGEDWIGTTIEACDDAAQVAVRLRTAAGTHKMVAAGAFSSNAELYGAADGKVDDTASGTLIARALEAATADGDVVEVVVLTNLRIAATSARSRAATALPTAAIWDNFNLEEMRSNPMAGSLLELDFTHGELLPSCNFQDAASLIALLPGTAGEGILTVFTTTDNQAAELQWPSCPITSSGGQPWAIEMRVKPGQIANTEGGWFVGLMAGDSALAGDLIADGATLADVGLIGFQNKEADGDILDVIYDKAGQAQNEHDDDYVTLVAGTYITVGLHYNGSTIAMYLNGVATGTAISAADIVAADFPAADILVPTIAMKSGAGAADVQLDTDWIVCAQQAE